MRGHNEKVAVYKSSRDPHQEPNLPAPDLGRPSLQNYENKCLLFNLFSLWYFVTGAQPDKTVIVLNINTIFISFYVESKRAEP